MCLCFLSFFFFLLSFFFLVVGVAANGVTDVWLLGVPPPLLLPPSPPIRRFTETVRGGPVSTCLELLDRGNPDGWSRTLLDDARLARGGLLPLPRVLDGVALPPTRPANKSTPYPDAPGSNDTAACAWSSPRRVWVVADDSAAGVDVAPPEPATRFEMVTVVLRARWSASRCTLLGSDSRRVNVMVWGCWGFCDRWGSDSRRVNVVCSAGSSGFPEVVDPPCPCAVCCPLAIAAASLDRVELPCLCSECLDDRLVWLRRLLAVLRRDSRPFASLPSLWPTERPRR